MAGLVDEALRLGARLSDNGTRPAATSLLRLEAIFGRWLLFRDHKALRAVLAAVAAHLAGGDGVWLFIVDAPGSGKTEILRSLNGLRDVVPLSSLTPQTFASGRLVKEEAKDPSLLLRLPPECVVTMKDFTTVLSLHHDSRQEILAQLRELADGSFVKEFGNGKTVSWEGRMCFIAGVTPAIDTHWSVNQTLGERFLQIRPAPHDPIQVGQRAMQNVGLEESMRQELRAAVTEFMGSLTYPPIGQVVVPGAMVPRLAALATLAVRARSAIVRDGYRREITYIPAPEGPARLAKQLSTVLRGRAIIDGREQVTEDDFAEIVNIGFDSVPPERRQVVNALIEGGDLTTTAIAKMTGYPTSPARRILEDLTAIGVVDRFPGREEGTNVDTWQLSEDASDWYRQIGVPEKSSRAGRGKTKDVATP